MGDVIQLHTELDLLPQNCAAEPVVCSDLGLNPAYQPLRARQVFQVLVEKHDTNPQPRTAAASAPASP